MSVFQFCDDELALQLTAQMLFVSYCIVSFAQPLVFTYFLTALTYVRPFVKNGEWI